MRYCAASCNQSSETTVAIICCTAISSAYSAGEIPKISIGAVMRSWRSASASSIIATAKPYTPPATAALAVGIKPNP